jgi:hypothetical protein
MKYLENFSAYTSKNNYYFDYTCVSPRDYNELEAIIEDFSAHDREVKCEEFLQKTNISFEEINEVLPVQYENIERLKKDWAVRFYIGEFYYDSDADYNKEECEEEGIEYIPENFGTLIQYACIVNSGIEHVWKKE